MMEIIGVCLMATAIAYVGTGLLLNWLCGE